MGDKVREPERIIALFNHNVGLEHGAIYQYLQHAYAIGEAGVGAEIINIARSEMRHLKYFADTVVELGGTVTLERPAVKVNAASTREMIQLGVEAEAEAIRDYSSQLALIEHPGAQRILERVIMDEQLHREQFADFETEVAEMVEQASFPSSGTPEDPKLAALLNEAFATEYNQVLVYLRHYFQVRNWEAKDFLFENTVWRMKHMSLMADSLHGQHTDPNFHWNPHPVEGTLDERLTQAIALEQEDAAIYERMATCPVPPELKRLFLNQMNHSHYQEAQMKLLGQLMASSDQVPAQGVSESERSPSELGPESPHGVAYVPKTPKSGLPGKWTVGSLLDYREP